jgi:hypothetical protein
MLLASAYSNAVKERQPMTIYRRIYQKHIGPIPIDENGLTYDIHHIDGDHSNNHPSNLKAVTLQEHYDIHESQGDIGACRAIRLRMKNGRQDRVVLSELSKEVQKRRIDNGTHNFLDRENAKQRSRKRIENGDHPFLRENFQKEIQNKIIQQGKHHLVGGKYQAKQLSEGKHPSQVVRTCPHCGKVGKGGGMILKHFNNCKKVLDTVELIR